MKVKIIRKNRQLKFVTTAEYIALLVKFVSFLLDLRHLDRLRFIRSLAGLIIKAVLMALNLTGEHYEPVIVQTTQIICRHIFKQGPPLQSLSMDSENQEFRYVSQYNH